MWLLSLRVASYLNHSHRGNQTEASPLVHCVNLKSDNGIKFNVHAFLLMATPPATPTPILPPLISVCACHFRVR